MAASPRTEARPSEPFFFRAYHPGPEQEERAGNGHRREEGEPRAALRVGEEGPDEHVDERHHRVPERELERRRNDREPSDPRKTADASESTGTGRSASSVHGPARRWNSRRAAMSDAPTIRAAVPEAKRPRAYPDAALADIARKETAKPSTGPRTSPQAVLAMFEGTGRKMSLARTRNRITATSVLSSAAFSTTFCVHASIRSPHRKKVARTTAETNRKSAMARQGSGRFMPS